MRDQRTQRNLTPPPLPNYTPLETVTDLAAITSYQDLVGKVVDIEGQQGGAKRIQVQAVQDIGGKPHILANDLRVTPESEDLAIAANKNARLIPLEGLQFSPVERCYLVDTAVYDRFAAENRAYERELALQKQEEAVKPERLKRFLPKVFAGAVAIGTAWHFFSFSGPKPETAKGVDPSAGKPAGPPAAEVVKAPVQEVLTPEKAPGIGTEVVKPTAKSTLTADKMQAVGTEIVTSLKVNWPDASIAIPAGVSDVDAMRALDVYFGNQYPELKSARQTAINPKYFSQFAGYAESRNIDLSKPRTYEISRLVSDHFPKEAGIFANTLGLKSRQDQESTLKTHGLAFADPTEALLVFAAQVCKDFRGDPLNIKTRPVRVGGNLSITDHVAGLEPVSGDFRAEQLTQALMFIATPQKRKSE